MLQMKEQDTNIQEQLNDKEIGNLSEEEFRVMVVNMIQISEKEWRRGSRRNKKCLTTT